MKPRQFRVLLGLLLIVGVLAVVFSTTFRTSLQYYVTVSELKAKEPELKNKILKVAGKAGPIELKEVDGKNEYHFTLLEGGTEVHIIYRGLAPDTFKEGADVVATGSLTNEGDFVATELLAKCASKYTAKVKP